jgi:hypothetical protein
VKNISEILNSIFQKAADPTAVQKSPLTGSQGPVEEKGSFEDILSRLASQSQDPATSQPPTKNTPETSQENVLSASSQVALPADNKPMAGDSVNIGSLFEASVSTTEVDIQVFGAAPVSGFNELDLQKLEQSILSFAVGLAKLLNLVSNLQGLQPSQAQELLSSLSNDKISQADIDQLLNQLSVFNQNTDPSLNPLSLSASQQASWLAQMLQNMLQNQQVFLAPSPDTSKADQVSGVGSGNKSAVYGMSLQYVFADTEVFQFQQSGSRQSLFAMDLQTMTLNMTSVSTFDETSIPAALSSGSSSLLSSDVVNRLSQLLSDLQVRPNPAPLVSVSAEANTSDISTGLMQNFKDLVQMLSQSGASQTVLSTLINQQKELSTNDLKQAFFQASTLTDLLKSLETAVAGFVKPVDATALAGQDSVDNNRQPNSLFNQGNLSSDTFSMRDQLAFIDNMVARLNLTASQGSIADSKIPETNSTPQLLMDQLIARISQYQPAVQNPDSEKGNGVFASYSQSQLEVQSQVSTVLNPGDAPKTQLLMERYLIEASQFQQTIQLQLSAVGNTVVSESQAGITKMAQTNILTGTPAAVTGPKPPELLRTIPEILVPVSAVNPEQTIENPVLLRTPAVPVLPAQVIPQANSAVQSLSSTIAMAMAFASAQPAAPAGKGNESAGPNVQAGNPVVPVMQPLEAQAVVPVVSTSDSATQMDSMQNPVILTAGKTSLQDNDGIPVIPLAQNLFLNSNDLNGEKIKLTSMGLGNTTGANFIQENSVNSLLIAHQVAAQIASHAEKSQAVSRMSFQLIPESLGRVTVQIVLIDQTMSARITVVNPVVKESLDHHMIELKTALNQAGLQINQLEVQVQGNGANLLAQYYQYQQEGFGYQMAAYDAPQALDGPENLQNADGFGNYSVRTSLVDLLV